MVIVGAEGGLFFVIFGDGNLIIIYVTYILGITNIVLNLTLFDVI